MQFRDLQKQYLVLKDDINEAMIKVASESNFISGSQVSELEQELAEYVGVKHCITCANGTDALSLALMAWDIKEGDAVFVPDFTFFASGEVVSYRGATPVFVDINENTFNIAPESLECAIINVLKEGKLKPKIIIAVDLFGLPAEYSQIKQIAIKYNLLILEDGAQGFGGKIGNCKVGSFGDISTTSFFPAKPLGCYGDGGAVFTNDDNTAKLIRSLCVHGKGSDKYDNVRIGINSRLDTMQAAILLVKLKAFKEYELQNVNTAAALYTELLKEYVKVPVIPEGFYSSWAQYSILLKSKEDRDGLQIYLKSKDIPTMIYYQKPMHEQKAFEKLNSIIDLDISTSVCNRVLSLPIHPYMDKDDIDYVVKNIIGYFHKNN